MSEVEQNENAKYYVEYSEGVSKFWFDRNQTELPEGEPYSPSHDNGSEEDDEEVLLSSEVAKTIAPMAFSEYEAEHDRWPSTINEDTIIRMVENILSSDGFKNIEDIDEQVCTWLRKLKTALETITERVKGSGDGAGSNASTSSHGQTIATTNVSNVSFASPFDALSYFRDRRPTVISSTVDPDAFTELDREYPGQFRRHSSDDDKVVCVDCQKTLKLFAGRKNSHIQNADIHIHDSKQHKDAVAARETARAGSLEVMCGFVRLSGRQTPSLPNLPSSDVVCTGMWREFVQFEAGGDTFNCKTILNKGAGNDWFPTPHVINWLNVENGAAPIKITGSFHSYECSKLSVNAHGQPTDDGMCAACRGIVRDPEFKRRVRRGNEVLEFSPGDSTNDRYLPEDAARAKLRHLQQEKKNARWAQHHYDRARRSRELKAQVKESAVRGDVGKLIDNIMLLAENGTFDQKRVMFNYVHDILGKEAAKLNNGGQYSKGFKMHETTRNLLVALQLQAPRCERMLEENVGGLHESSVARHRSAAQRPFEPQTSSRSNLEDALVMYTDILGEKLDELGCDEHIILELSEDETGIVPGIYYDFSTDVLIGTCGEKDGEFYSHMCDLCGGCPTVGNDETSFGTVVDVITNRVRSTHARAIMINPQHDDLPPLAIYIGATCNRFDHTAVREQWDQLDQLCKQVLGRRFMVVGNASDGDARRFKLQSEDMSMKRDLPKTGEEPKSGDAFTFNSPYFKDRYSGEYFYEIFSAPYTPELIDEMAIMPESRPVGCAPTAMNTLEDGADSMPSTAAASIDDDQSPSIDGRSTEVEQPRDSGETSLESVPAPTHNQNDDDQMKTDNPELAIDAMDVDSATTPPTFSEKTKEKARRVLRVLRVRYLHMQDSLHNRT